MWCSTVREGWNVHFRFNKTEMYLLCTTPAPVHRLLASYIAVSSCFRRQRNASSTYTYISCAVFCVAVAAAAAIATINRRNRKYQTEIMKYCMPTYFPARCAICMLKNDKNTWWTQRYQVLYCPVARVFWRHIHAKCASFMLLLLLVLLLHMMRRIWIQICILSQTTQQSNEWNW